MPLPLFITFAVMASLEEDFGQVLASEEDKIFTTEDGAVFIVEDDT